MQMQEDFTGACLFAHILTASAALQFRGALLSFCSPLRGVR